MLEATITPHFTHTSWLSMPSFSKVMNAQSPAAGADALTAMVINSEAQSQRRLTRLRDCADETRQDSEAPRELSATPRIHLQPSSRPKSYHPMLQDFDGAKPVNEVFAFHETLIQNGGLASSLSENIEIHSKAAPFPMNNTPRTPRQEDTVRRHKRFSSPAVALQNLPVTATPKPVGTGGEKRHSLVTSSTIRSPTGIIDDVTKNDLAHGVAAIRLAEILALTA